MKWKNVASKKRHLGEWLGATLCGRVTSKTYWVKYLPHRGRFGGRRDCKRCTQIHNQ